MAQTPPLTAGEIVKVTWIVARMCKRGIAGDDVYQGDLEKRLDRILDAARLREEQQAKSK